MAVCVALVGAQALGEALLYVAGAAAVLGPIVYAERRVTGPLWPGLPLLPYGAAALGLLAVAVTAGTRAAVALVLVGALSWALYTRSRAFHRLRARRLAFESVAKRVGAPDTAEVRTWLRVRRSGVVELSYNPREVRAHDPKVRADLETALGNRFGCEFEGVWPATSTRALLKPVAAVPAAATLDEGLVEQLGDGVLAIARGRADELVTLELERTPHVLVTGKTGGGKSVTMRSLAWQASRWAEVIVLDVKLVDYLGMSGVRRVSDFAGQLEAVSYARDEITRRLEVLEAGRKLRAERLVVVVDEASTLTVTAREAAKADRAVRGAHPLLVQLGEIARLGRQVGVHLIVGLQRPDVTMLCAPDGGEFRDNLGGRVVCGRLLSSDGASMALSSPDAAHAALELPDVRGRGVVEIDGAWQTAQLLKPAKGVTGEGGGVAIDLRPSPSSSPTAAAASA